AGAAVHVDGHAPGVVLVDPVGEQRRPHVGGLMALVGKPWILLVFIQCGIADDSALLAQSLHAFERTVGLEHAARDLAAMILIVALGDRHAPLAVGFLDGAGGVERSIAGADQVGVEALIAGYATAKRTAIAEIYRDRVIRMAWSHDHRRLHRFAAGAQLDNVIFLEAKLGQSGARNDRRIVPAQV